ncbi:MAG: MarR family winged helix-turn-helix transcriptional regulator [Bdellovibrionota bacterium]
MVKLTPKDCLAEDPASYVIHPALKEYFTYRFYKLALRLRAEVNMALKKHGILGIHLGLMRVLEIEGSSSQISLGRSLGIDKATMVKLIDELEQSGFVHRDAVEGDRRVKHIRLTAKGAKVLQAGTQIREDVEEKFFGVLSKSERDSLDRALTKLVG